MTGEWRGTSLGEVVRLQRGYDLPDKDRKPGSVPVMGSFGVTGWHHVARAKGPGVTVGRSGASIGVVSFVREDYWPLNTCLYVTDFQGNDPRFCYYWLGTLDLANYNSGSAQPSLNRNYIYGMPVRVPRVNEQRAIAHILGTLDDKIELNRRMNETLEAMARAIFKSWFVDFDPVRAKAERRDPGLPKPLADLFPDSFEDSQVGEIPVGWRVVPLPEVIEVNPPRSLRKGQVAPYLDMANMPTRGHSPEALVERPFGSGMRFINGDTLLARITPCLENGKTALVDFLQEGQVGWGSTEYIVLRPRAPLPAEYAYCLARCMEFRDFAIQSMTRSSGRQRVAPESLSHFLTTSPSDHVAEAFGHLVKPLFTGARAATEPPGQWRGPGEGPAHSLADTPDGAWAEFLRHEGITRPEELRGIDRAIWAVEVPNDLVAATREPELPYEVLAGGLESYHACRGEAHRLRQGGPTVFGPSQLL